MIGRLAGDESFAAELRARNERAAAEAALRPKPEPKPAPAPAPASAPGPEGAAEGGDEASEDAGKEDWDEGAPEWPDETTESAMLAELNQRADTAVPEPREKKVRRRQDRESEAGEPLPEVDALVETIPPEVRKTLDELFRAQFTGVRRVPEAVLKSAEVSKR